MKKIFFFILFVSFSNFLIGQSKSSGEEELAKQLIKGSFEEVWSNLDVEKVKEYHTDDFLLLEDGVVWNNDSIINYQHRALQTIGNTKRHNKFDFVKVEKSGNSIWLAYHNYASWTNEGKVVGEAHWLESAVAIRTEDGWKLKMLHSTRVKNE